MAISITDITQLDPTAVQARSLFFADFLKAAYPDLDLNPSSALYQLMVVPNAILAVQQDVERQRVYDSMSMVKVVANPDAADPDTLANLMSNYGITVAGATISGGLVRIIVPTNTTFPVKTDTIFTSGSTTFTPSQAYVAVPAAGLVTGISTPLMTPYGAPNEDGTQNYSFVIEVVAVQAGAAGNIRQGTVLSMSTSQPIVQAVAAADFGGGTDTETNQELLARAGTSIASQNFGSRISTRALLTAKFPNITDISTIGAGDAEMVREIHPVFGVRRSGLVDIHVRTQLLPTTQTLTVHGTHQGGGLWTCRLDRATAPVILYVQNAKSADATRGLTISQVRRLLDAAPVPGTDHVPYFRPGSNDHVFTRYQRTEVDIQDQSGLDAAGLTTLGQDRTFQIDVTSMPGIDEVSDFALSRENDSPGSDILLRSIFPCFVDVTMTITLQPTDPDIDATAIAAAISAAINGLPMSVGRLSADVVVTAARSVLGTTGTINLPLDMVGQVVIPVVQYTPGQPQADGLMWLQGPNTLSPGSYFQASPRTIAFSCSPSDVVVNVTRTPGTGAL